MKHLSIVTRTGDKGETSLYTGERVPKDHVRMMVIGEIDELNAHLSLIRSHPSCPEKLSDQLLKLQSILFRLGGDIATPLAVSSKQDRMNEADLEMLDTWAQDIEARLPEQHAFFIPGGTELSSRFHIARTVCRRAERTMVTLERSERVNPLCQSFINRLSDVLYLCAREAVIGAGENEEEVRY